jgi:benzoylformate decarboxylase
VIDPNSLLRLTRRAIKTACTPPMGPVFLGLPMDVLDLPNTELIARSQPVDQNVIPDDALIAEAAKLLREAEAPLILMGDGIAAAGAQAELTEVAELLGAPVWGGNCSEVNMATSHPLFAGYLGHMFGAASKPILSAASCVLICGTTVLPEVFPSPDGVFGENAKVIHFDLNDYEIGKNFPVRIGAVAEPKATLRRLAQILRQTMTAAEKQRAGDRMARQKTTKAKDHGAAIKKDAAAWEQVPMRPARFMQELAQRLKSLSHPAIVFDEALTSSPELLRYIPQDEPETYFQTRSACSARASPALWG